MCYVRLNSIVTRLGVGVKTEMETFEYLWEMAKMHEYITASVYMHVYKYMADLVA